MTLADWYVLGPMVVFALLVARAILRSAWPAVARLLKAIRGLAMELVAAAFARLAARCVIASVWLQDRSGVPDPEPTYRATTPTNRDQRLRAMRDAANNASVALAALRRVLPAGMSAVMMKYPLDDGAEVKCQILWDEPPRADRVEMH